MNRFSVLVAAKTGFQMTYQGWVKSEKLPLLLRIQFPDSDFGPMVGFLDSATEFQLSNTSSEQIVIRIELRRGSVCFVQVSGELLPRESLYEMISALKAEFPRLAVVESVGKDGQNGAGHGNNLISD